MPTVRRTYNDLDEAALLHELAAVPAITDEEAERQAAEDGDASTPEELQSAKTVLSTIVGDRIARVRARLGLSQAEFANRFGLTVEFVRRYEAGEKRPSWAVAWYLWLIEADPDRVANSVARLAERRHALQQKAG